MHSDNYSSYSAAAMKIQVMVSISHKQNRLKTRKKSPCHPGDHYQWDDLSIYIPWPFPSVWAVADKKKKKKKKDFTPFF